jgi:hypothetical protein
MFEGQAQEPPLFLTTVGKGLTAIVLGGKPILAMEELNKMPCEADTNLLCTFLLITGF